MYKFKNVPIATAKELFGLRPCSVNGRKAWFHCWIRTEHPYFISTAFYSKEEIKKMTVKDIQKAYKKQSESNVYNFNQHVAMTEALDEDGKLPATFMMMPPASWSDKIWDDINRMRTLNTTQSQRCKNLHVCPLQLDIVERIINRYSNEGDFVLDPFGGLMTVPYTAVKMNRRGYGIELNADYFRDGVGYLKSAEEQYDTPTLFDFISVGA